MDESPQIPEYIIELMESNQLEDEIKIDSEGQWFHNNTLIENPRFISFFNKSINKTKDGTFVLHYSNYTYPIIVEDVPYFITGVIFEGFGDFEKITINISNGTSEELDEDTLFYKKNILYCKILDQDFDARFKRSPSFHILERLDEKNGQYILNICGKSIILKQE
jgi:hypothetical protein